MKQRTQSPASMMTGDPVRNSAGEHLGHIEHIVIGTPSGRVLAVLDIDRETHENAPGFSKDRWPNMADAAFAAAIQRH